MMETAAQLVSYYVMSQMPDKGFLGFGGVDDVKFRGSVSPGEKVLMLGKMLEMRSRRCIGATQAMVDGKIVYEGIITGMWV
jgi:3-hydroxyacyl-[acyl-carrier-protein] dehydratase